MIIFDSIILCDKVALVGNQCDNNISIRKLSDLLQPALEVSKRFVTSDVVYEERAHSKPVMSCGNTDEFLVSRGVPNLRLDLLVAVGELSGLGFELYSESCF